MKLVPITRGPLTALALLVACSSPNSGSDALNNRGSAATIATASPASEGVSATAIDSTTAVSSVDSLPACTSETEGLVQSVNTPDGLGIYYCTQGAWQLLPLEGTSSVVGSETDGGQASVGLTIARGSCALIQVGVDDNHNSLLEPDEVDTLATFCAAALPGGSGDAGSPVASDSGAPAPADAGAPIPTDASAPAPADAGTPAPADAGPAQPDSGSTPTPVLGACLSCAKEFCSIQYEGALGSASSPENLRDVRALLACVVGDDFETSAVPSTSCFFADPANQQGTLTPCYCGNTPIAQCLASGPVDDTEACGAEVKAASGCNPASAACVTSSGSNPAVALGDVLQLLNCERAACQVQCGFPEAIEE